MPFSSIRGGIAGRKSASRMSAEARRDRAKLAAEKRWGVVSPPPELPADLVIQCFDRLVTQQRHCPGFSYNRGQADAIIAWLRKCTGSKPAK